MYTASGTADNPKFAVRRARTAKAAIPTTEAYDKGANGDLALFAASGTADNPKATASAARRTHTARAAIRVAKANGSNNGARNEGSGDDEAEASAVWCTRHQPSPQGARA